MTSEDPKKEAPTQLSAEEVQQLLQGGPAFYSNKVYLSVVADGARLTFAETLPGASDPPIVRTAVFLSPPDLLALRDLLVAQTQNIRVIEVAADGKLKVNG